MPDNVVTNAGSGGATFVTASFTWSGDSAHSQGIFAGILSGSEGVWTYSLLVGGAGVVTAGTPRVTLASDDPAVAKLTTIDADTSILAAAVSGTDRQHSHDSDVAVAVGGQATLDSSQVGVGKTGHLLMAVVAGSVPWKAQLYTVSDGVASSVVATWFSANPTPIFQRNMVAVAYSATAGLDGFRVVVTNLSPNPNDTADLYASFFWDEV